MLPQFHAACGSRDDFLYVTLDTNPAPRAVRMPA
jgi:hypothetical protein